MHFTIFILLIVTFQVLLAEFFFSQLFQVLVIFGTSVVRHHGYFRVIRYSFIWKILAGAIFYFIGGGGVFLLILYLTLDGYVCIRSQHAT